MKRLLDENMWYFEELRVILDLVTKLARAIKLPKKEMVFSRTQKICTQLGHKVSENNEGHKTYQAKSAVILMVSNFCRRVTKRSGYQWTASHHWSLIKVSPNTSMDLTIYALRFDFKGRELPLDTRC